jgi:outer membrane immunogenic protein
MRTFILAGTSILALSTAALSADMAVKAPVRAATPFTWTGGYLGVNAGWVRGSTDLSWSPTTTGGPAFQSAFVAATTSGNTTTGFTAGGQIGYNWQTGNIVMGIEGDLNATDLSGSRRFLLTIPGFTLDTVNQIFQSSWLATLRGRVGFTADRFLVYGTGGLALANVSTTDTYASITFGDTFTNSSSQVRAGWSAGGGVEYAFTGNWSGKLEYIHADLGTVSYTLLGTGGTTSPFTASHRIREDIVRVGASYHLN